MQKEVLLANSRGSVNLGWLKSHHTFSFGSYYDPARMGFGLLRVLNDDRVEPGKGFDTHGHNNMEIVSIPLKGALEHKDSKGNQTIIKHGDVQLMSAGSGVTHSEYNHSKNEAVEFLQIWVMPKELDIEPRYDQKRFSKEGRQNKIQFIVSPIDSELDGVKINQNAFFALSDLTVGEKINYRQQSSESGLFIMVIEGTAKIAEELLSDRDSIAVHEISHIDILAISDCKILIIEVPM